MLYTEINSNPIVFLKDKIQVHIFNSREDMGKKAAEDTAAKIKEILQEKNEVNMIFAAAPSQNEFLKYLVNDLSIPWEKINAFHMDEYIGLSANAPQGFGNFLKERLFEKVPFKSVQYINGLVEDIQVECDRYEKLLMDYPVDIVCLGIGENGHIAFNDPPVADFNDKVLVKEVELDPSCRQQQVNENCFTSIDLVPLKAITLTIPALMKAKYMFCVVPSANKAKAVYETLHHKISEKYPATILRTKEDMKLYLDKDSASLLIYQ
ncbi:Glucosamine-6-phosphate isomerase [uncultured Paludibacter sp.]|uniref:Glucosamine-6-phosphate isomerase n=1 Tax=uncultured Paludibacter sp. TaxID=497635 RepID=A0A653AKF7_9BACT|nr:Glucosamine-6-phosphate isomerase [uncultured Paludibacter sp.]